MRYLAVIVAIIYSLYAATAQAAQSVNVEWTAPDTVGMLGYKAYMINIDTQQVTLVTSGIPVYSDDCDYQL